MRPPRPTALAALMAALLLGLTCFAFGGGPMDYRVLERHYGPDIRPNDWQPRDARLVFAGGVLQVFAEGSGAVSRNDCELPGGGDVRISVSLNFERVGPTGRLALQFNCPRKGDPGFQVMFGEGKTRVMHGAKVVFEGDGPKTDRGRVHTVALTTLGEEYAIEVNGEQLVSGRMAPPYTANEGRLRLQLQDVDIRLISCEEQFIQRDVAFPQWRREKPLYTETFGPESLRLNWVCNGAEPGVTDDAFTFNPMSVCVLKQRFDGPLAMDCVATPAPTVEYSAGVTDAIFIWMLDRPDGDLLEYMAGLPDASLSHYMPLPFYWVDFGGTNNQTTRLRRNPRRRLMRQFNDRARLLERDRTYHITLVQSGNGVEFWVDGKMWVQAYDDHPLTGGHVGLRSYVAGLTVSELRLWRIGNG